MGEKRDGIILPTHDFFISVEMMERRGEEKGGTSTMASTMVREMVQAREMAQETVTERGIKKERGKYLRSSYRHFVMI